MIFTAADLPSFDNWYKALGTLGAFGTFLWTVYTWREKSLKELEASKDDAQRANRARIIEATKPFLDLQLNLYQCVTKAAALIATSGDESEVRSSMHDFLRLYSGELALVENEDVATAMQNFRRAISDLEARGAVQNRDDPTPKPLATIEEREGIQQLSLQLARACRNSLAKSWHVEAWANPDDAI